MPLSMPAGSRLRTKNAHDATQYPVPGWRPRKQLFTRGVQRRHARRLHRFERRMAPANVGSNAAIAVGTIAIHRWYWWYY